MNIPINLNRQPINQNRIIPSKLPSQALHLHHRVTIDPYHQTRVIRQVHTHRVTFYQYLMNLPLTTKLSPCRIRLLSKHIRSFRNKNRIWRQISKFILIYLLMHFLLHVP
ncbi:hypothetical protein Hanom_Chr04g00348201 [Helianthus anomalus]